MTVGDTEGKRLGDWVGITVGTLVGKMVGAVGDRVGILLGEPVGSGVGGGAEPHGDGIRLGKREGARCQERHRVHSLVFWRWRLAGRGAVMGPFLGSCKGPLCFPPVCAYGCRPRPRRTEETSQSGIQPR
jgi:hypothetical protein